MAVDRNAPKAAGRYDFALCDILDAPRLASIVESFAPEAVVHLAARTDVDSTATLPDYATNVTGVENVIAAIRATRSVRRAIYTSTQLVCRVGYRPQHDQDYAPNTIYGQSKVLSEQIVRREDGGGVTWCLVRPTTVWGPGMSEHYQRFLGMLRRGTYFHVGGRPLLKSFGFIGNVVFQYVRMLDVAPEKIHGMTFYVGDYQPLSLQQWAEAIAVHFGRRRIRTVPPSVARVAARVGDAVNALGFRRFPFNSFRLKNVLTEYTFDLTKTREICGDLPYSLDEAARLTAEWYASRQ